MSKTWNWNSEKVALLVFGIMFNGFAYVPDNHGYSALGGELIMGVIGINLSFMVICYFYFSYFDSEAIE